MSDGSKTSDGSARSSPQQQPSSPKQPLGSVDLDELLPLANMSTEARHSYRSASEVLWTNMSDVPIREFGSLQNFYRMDESSDETLPPDTSSSEDARQRFSSMDEGGPRISFAREPSVTKVDEATNSGAGSDDDTVINFSMLVKSSVPRERTEEVASQDERLATYEPVRYRPQVLVNDWFEVTQRRELNKYRHLKLQKGPSQSAYDHQFQHPFAPRMQDSEECERKRNSRTRKLWTYLVTPTEYTEHFNEPYRKK